METKIADVPMIRKSKQTVSTGEVSRTGNFFFPFIRLHGKYLLQFDFNIGDKIEVSVGKGKIFIRKVLNAIP